MPYETRGREIVSYNLYWSLATCRRVTQLCVWHACNVPAYTLFELFMLIAVNRRERTTCALSPLAINDWYSTAYLVVFNVYSVVDKYRYTFHFNNNNTRYRADWIEIDYHQLFFVLKEKIETKAELVIYLFNREFILEQIFLKERINNWTVIVCIVGKQTNTRVIQSKYTQLIRTIVRYTISMSLYTEKHCCDWLNHMFNSYLQVKNKE